MITNDLHKPGAREQVEPSLLDNHIEATQRFDISVIIPTGNEAGDPSGSSRKARAA